MPKFIANIPTRLKEIEENRAAYHNETVRALELIYLRAMNSPRPSLSDAFAATAKISLSFIFLPEFYFLLAGIAVIIFIIGPFSEPGMDYGSLRPVLFAIVGVLAGIIPLALAFLTTPFHIMFGASIWLLTGINAFASALVFSAIEPFIAASFFDHGIASFSQLFLPMLIFYSIAEFYLLSRMNKYLNFNHYKRRHRQPSIENLVPAHKGGQLISMSSQDHYVEIVTEGGSHLERLTIKKAVELAPKSDGLQVHRSHWVAYNAMLRLEKTGGRHAILLRNGAKVPVGKSRLAEVQAYLDSR